MPSGLENVVVADAVQVPVMVLVGSEKSAFDDTIRVIELTVAVAVPFVTTTLVMLSLNELVEYAGRSTPLKFLPPIRQGFIVVFPVTIQVTLFWVISLSVA